MHSRLERIADWETLARRAGYRSHALARAVGVTPRQLERYFRRQHQSTPKAWLDSLRLAHAAAIRRPDLLAKELATEVGLSGSAALARFLRRCAKRAEAEAMDPAI